MSSTNKELRDRMTIISFIEDHKVIDKIIAHLKLTFHAERTPPPQFTNYLKVYGGIPRYAEVYLRQSQYGHNLRMSLNITLNAIIISSVSFP